MKTRLWLAGYECSTVCDKDLDDGDGIVCTGMIYRSLIVMEDGWMDL